MMGIANDKVTERRDGSNELLSSNPVIHLLIAFPATEQILQAYNYVNHHSHDWPYKFAPRLPLTFNDVLNPPPKI
jgi:hypothetical protein